MFPDYFSAVAAKYAAYRPRYPAALAEGLAALAPARELAWDIGCGSGQLSTTLGDPFARVIATDPSPQQLERAAPHPRVEYRCAPAEASGLPDGSVDLAVAAQAAHWFDWPRFLGEVARVTRPGSLIALVAYGDVLVEGGEDPAVARYKRLVDDYWPDKRRHVDNRYRELELPWPSVPTFDVTLEAAWTCEELAGYVSSWSATNELRKQHPDSTAFQTLCDELAATWREGERRRVHWPMIMKLARRDG